MDQRTNEDAGAVHDIRDLTKVLWKGDDKMRAFQNDFDAVLSGCKSSVGVDNQLYWNSSRRAHVSNPT